MATPSPSEHTDGCMFRPRRDSGKSWDSEPLSLKMLLKFVLSHFEHVEGSAEAQCNVQFMLSC